MQITINKGGTASRVNIARGLTGQNYPDGKKEFQYSETEPVTFGAQGPGGKATNLIYPKSTAQRCTSTMAVDGNQHFLVLLRLRLVAYSEQHLHHLAPPFLRRQSWHHSRGFQPKC